MKRITDFNLSGFIILGIIIVTWVYVISIFVGGDKSNNTSSSNYSTASKELHSGQSVTLNKDELVCSSKANLDKLLSIINQKNKDGENQMLLNGQATFLRKGTKLNVIDGGIAVSEIETSTGEHWFTTRETLQDAL
jgi:hypothetical protein